MQRHRTSTSPPRRAAVNSGLMVKKQGHCAQDNVNDLFGARGSVAGLTTSI